MKNNREIIKEAIKNSRLAEEYGKKYKGKALTDDQFNMILPLYYNPDIIIKNNSKYRTLFNNSLVSKRSGKITKAGICAVISRLMKIKYIKSTSFNIKCDSEVFAIKDLLLTNHIVLKGVDKNIDNHIEDYINRHKNKKNKNNVVFNEIVKNIIEGFEKKGFISKGHVTYAKRN